MPFSIHSGEMGGGEGDGEGDGRVSGRVGVMEVSECVR